MHISDEILTSKCPL